MKTQNSPQVLELLEERAYINKDRVSTGKVILSKQARTRTVNLPITLTEEYLVITYEKDLSPLNHHTPTSDSELIDIIDNTTNTHAYININGKMKSLELDTPIEILLSRETATLTKTTHAIEEIALNTETLSQEHTFTTQIQKEVLNIEGDESLIIDKKTISDNS